MTSTTVGGALSTYSYAGASQDELLSLNVSGGTGYTYTYGKNDQNGVPVIDTYTTGTTPSRILSDAVTGQPLDLTTSTGDSAAYLTDGTGNQVGALTDTGTNAFTASYDPYGTGSATTGSTSPFWTSNPYGYKGGFRSSADQNNLVKFGQRWYLPSTGGWTQRDTLDTPLDPSNANRYAYAAGDPITRADMSGQYDVVTALDIGAASGIGAGIGGCAAGLVASVVTAEITAAPACVAGGLTGAVGGFVSGFVGNSLTQLI